MDGLYAPPVQNVNSQNQFIKTKKRMNLEKDILITESDISGDHLELISRRESQFVKPSPKLTSQ
jgi:hypothetical protein